MNIVKVEELQLSNDYLKVYITIQRVEEMTLAWPEQYKLAAPRSVTTSSHTSPRYTVAI
jgi:hypothetical protein